MFSTAACVCVWFCFPFKVSHPLVVCMCAVRSDIPACIYSIAALAECSAVGIKGKKRGEELPCFKKEINQ